MGHNFFLKLIAGSFLCFIIALLPVSGYATERILDFTSVIQVHTNSTITVTETISVRAEAHKIKRGIYRDLPMLQQNSYGTDYPVDLEVRSVRRNGHFEPYFIKTEARNQRIYIGDKDVFLKPGNHEYTITYTVRHQIGFLESHDELAWNVTGNDWSFPIDRVKAIVKLPSGAIPLQQEGYSGSFGDTGKNFGVAKDLDGNTVFTTIDPLQPGEGLTVAVGWPKGIVKKPVHLPQQTPPSERILNYDSRILVKNNGLLEVTENIRIVCGPEKINNGLWRRFSKFHESSIKIKTPRPTKRIVEITTSSMDGEAVPTRMTESSSTLWVHWGPQEKYLAPGEHVFELSYVLDRQIHRGTEMEQLFWSVRGYDWPYPIEKVNITIEYPAEARLLQSSFAEEGSHSRNKLTVNTIKPGLIQATSKNILISGQSLVVHLGWHVGTLSAPSPMRWLRHAFMDYYFTFFGGFALILVLSYFLITWYRVGRDPKKGTVIPLFEPPDNLSPAAIRYLVERGEDNTLLSLSIINMAVNRCLLIQEVDDNYQLEKGTRSSDVLSLEEKAAFNKLFQSEDSVELKSANATRLRKARRTLNKRLKTLYGKEYFSNNYGWIFLGALLSLIPQGLVTMDSSQLEWGIVYAVSLALCSGAAILIGYFTIEAWGQLFAGQARFFGVLMLTLLLALPILGVEYTLIKSFADIMPTAGFILFLVSPIMVAVFFQLLRSYTPKGRKIMDQIQGFTLYLKTSEEERLQLLHPPEKTAELFERFLPYAQALNLEHAWCQRFDNILQDASQGPKTQYSPAWYSGANWTPNTPSFFMENFSKRFSSSLSSASRRPKSKSWSGGSGSRFSGGGFSSRGGSSGGGGGGGGGGGW